MLEIALGFLIVGAAGVRGPALVLLGVPLGVIIYFGSCLYWQEWPCWSPFCTARKQTARGPGKRIRRRRKCWRCGGRGTVDRWGTRLMARRGG